MALSPHLLSFSLGVSQQVLNVHRGAVLPAARVVVIAVPLAALTFYLVIVRRRRDR